MANGASLAGLGDLGPTSRLPHQTRVEPIGSSDYSGASVGGGVELLIPLSAEDDDLNDLSLVTGA